MIVRVHVELPTDGIWELKLPDFPDAKAGKRSEEYLQDWVWKHGRDQLLSKLGFSTSHHQVAQATNNSNSGETQQEQDQLRPRLDLMEKLQIVKQDFLERVQSAEVLEMEDEEEKADGPSLQAPNNPVNVALRELLDSVLEWSKADYGFIAGVEQQVVQRHQSNESMFDVSELDHSDLDNRNYKWVVGPKLAAVNVPYYRDDDDDDDDNDLSTDQDEGDSSDESQPRAPPQRPPQPITTYGPVHYKNIPGSITLMMDQLRFEPFNPLDLLSEHMNDDDSEQDEDDDATARHEYNYMEVYWDKVEKYQLTPKTSTSSHLFRLTFRKQGAKTVKPNTSEVVFKMKSRAELERITEDVKNRVVLPSRNKGKPPIGKAKDQKRRKRRTSKKVTLDESASTHPEMTPRERSVMMPPSKPRRMTSERNLLRPNRGNEVQTNHLLGNNPSENVSPAPRRPVRRPTAVLVNPMDSDDDISKDDDDDDGDGNLWAIHDLLAKCREMKRPLVYRARKRDRRADGEANTSVPVPLLPPKWQWLVVIPILEGKESSKVRALVAIAATDEQTSDCPLAGKFGSKKYLEWWLPTVTIAVQDLFQHKIRLEELRKNSKIVQDLHQKLKQSLQKHSDMIHGILPPMAISKLKLQPEQWKSPLQQFFHLPPKLSVIPVSTGISVDDSSISGSVHSRYGLLIGGLPSLEDNSTVQTAVQGGNSGESEYGLYSVSENNDQRGHNLPERSNSTKTAQQLQPQGFSRPTPQRTNSVGNMANINAAIRGLHRQGSVTNRAGATRPIFSRIDSKRGMMMMRTGSARGGGLMKMDSGKRGNLMKMDSGRFSRGIPRLASLRSLHGGLSVATSGGASVDTFDQSWRTMWPDEESLQPEDLSDRDSTKVISVLTQDVSYLTSETSVRYINSSFIGGIKDVQALFAERKKKVSIVVISIVRFYDMANYLKIGAIMDVHAKVLFTVDRLCEKHGAIKVYVIGSTIIVMSGLFMAEGDDDNGDKRSSKARHERKAALAALDLAKELVSEAQTIVIPKDFEDDKGSAYKKTARENLKLRVGIHVGDVNYGVIGQNVPQLNCFGDDIAVALRMEQTAPPNCIRASKGFHDLVGDVEKDWEKQAEPVGIFRHPWDSGAEWATAEILSSTSRIMNSARQNESSGPSPVFTMETFTLEPPPPAISGGNCASSISSFPSLAPWGSDHGPGRLLGVQLEESFVSGEFDVD